MKILILTCNTGQGHNSTANSIKEKFKKFNIECDSTDALSFVSKNMSDFIGDMHVKLYRYAPILFDRGYEFAEKYPSVFADDSVAYNFFCLGVDKLKAFIEEGGYTGVICAHVFSALMVTELIKKYSITLKTAFVATDYTCSPGVAETNLDAYFIPHEGLIGEFIACGVPEEKLIPSGIPVKEVFYNVADKNLARRELSIPYDAKHILMMCGSMGCGPMEDITEKLKAIMPDNVHLTVVCGTNEKLQKRIEKFANRNIHVVGFASNVPTLMDSADLYVTKPGGLSVTEAVTKRLPLVFIDAVSGCEGYNRYFFLTRGMALASNDQSKLPRLIIKRLLDSPALLKQKETMRQEFYQNPAEIICDYFIR